MNMIIHTPTKEHDAWGSVIYRQQIESNLNSYEVKKEYIEAISERGIEDIEHCAGCMISITEVGAHIPEIMVDVRKTLCGYSFEEREESLSWDYPNYRASLTILDEHGTWCTDNIYIEMLAALDSALVKYENRESKSH